MLKGPLSTRASLLSPGLLQELRTLPEGGCPAPGQGLAVFCCVASPGLRSATLHPRQISGGSPEIGSQFRRRENKLIPGKEYVFRNI